MGGRGSNINAAWRRAFAPIGAGGVPGAGMGARTGAGGAPNVQPGQPVPAVTVAQFQAMDGQQFSNYLNGLKSTPIDSNIYYNSDWDTQRLVANMPELNRAPQVVDAATFASLPGETLYRTVNQTGRESAVGICARTMTSDVTTIGEGVMGDGFYFSNSLTASQGGYGRHTNNINKTATMQAKLNSNARVVSSSNLNSMLSQENANVQRAVRNMNSGGSWGGSSGLMAYALWKGYNVVDRDGSTKNIIDRSAATWSGELMTKK